VTIEQGLQITHDMSRLELTLRRQDDGARPEQAQFASSLPRLARERWTA
jgi:hypothetical protein